MSMKPCPETFPYPLIALDETDSTNRYISQLCNELQESVAELTTVTAEFQTAGKGQRGNTWVAKANCACAALERAISASTFVIFSFMLGHLLFIFPD